MHQHGECCGEEFSKQWQATIITIVEGPRPPQAPRNPEHLFNQSHGKRTNKMGARVMVCVCVCVWGGGINVACNN